MRKINRLVIADDLTGANDTGVQFLSRGEPVSVVVDSDREEVILDDSAGSTIVLNTNSRFLSGQEAYLKTLRSVTRYAGLAPVEVFKKIDSTLRGNIGAEIDAVMTGSGYRVACVAPAAPRNGRSVIDGSCYVNGVALNQTEIADDPFTPVSDSDIGQIISSQTARAVGLLKLEELRKIPVQALASLKALVDSGKEIIVADSETVEDLKTARILFEQLGEKVLYAGSAGFFHALRAVSDDPMRAVDWRGVKNPRILFVVGSLMETSSRQVEHLLGRVDNCTVRQVITARAVENQAGESERLSRLIESDLREGKISLLQTEKGSKGVADNAGMVGSVLGLVVESVAEKAGIDVLFATGGDTARHILEHLGVETLRLVGELRPGIPLAEIRLPGSDKTVLFISKAGSYGEENALEEVVHFLNGSHDEENAYE